MIAAGSYPGIHRPEHGRKQLRRSDLLGCRLGIDRRADLAAALARVGDGHRRHLATACTAGNALEAAQQALAALCGRNARATPADEPPLEIVIALHYGTVIYGNVGAADPSISR